MKYSAVLAIALLAISLTPSALGQACYTPITNWQGVYSMTGTGSGPDNQGNYNWTINHQLSATPNLPTGMTSCTALGFGGLDTTATGSFDDHGTSTCEPDGTANNVDVTGGPLVLSTNRLEVDLSGSTYRFAPFANLTASVVYTVCGHVVTTGGPYAAEPFDSSCAGDVYPKYSLPTTIEPLSQSGIQFAGTVCPWGAPSNWTMDFALIPIYKDDKDCKQKGGSTLGCLNQSLGEDVAIVGTGFTLHYEGSRTAVAGAGSLVSNDALMIGGWTLSAHHLFDPSTQTLYLGDGSQRNGYQLGTPLTYLGNSLITSEEGDEVYVFSPSGQHLQTLRPLTGAVLFQFGYNSAGSLIAVTDANGNATTIRRNSAGRATAIVSPYAQITTLTLDTNGFLTQIKDPLGHIQSFTNTPLGQIIARTDANGNIYSYTYEATGRLIKDADPVGGYLALTRTNAATGVGWTVAHATAMGRSSSYQSAVTLPWAEDPNNPSFSQQRTIIWPNGLQATAGTSQKGTLRTESYTLPDGTSDSETFGPDPVWGIQVPISTNDTLTHGSLTMNATTRRTTTLGTAGNPFTVATQTDTETINGRTYTFSFSGSTRTYVNTTPVGRTLTVGLDTLERVASMRLGTLTATNFAYDSRGRLASATQGSRRTAFSYNSKGFMASVTDPLKQKTSFTYDADGRLATTTLPDGRTINYAYDANGNLSAETPPGQPQHDLTYTAVDLLESYTPPGVLGTGPTTYAYDLDRNLTSVSRPDGQTISYGYDTAGQLSSITAPSVSDSYTYDAATGNPVAATRGSERITYSYDGPLPTKTTWTGTVKGSVGRNYNNNFWVSSQNVGGGINVTLQHDNDGLLTKAGALTIKRSASNGLITGTTLGVATDSRTYDSFGELAAYTAAVSGGTIYKVTYARDADGRVSAKAEILGTATNSYSYSYDLAGRLTAVAKNTETDDYSYDTNSNRLSATTPSGTASGTYDAQDRLLTYGNASYIYTAAGELAHQKVGSQTTSYKYDALGNLISVTLPNGTKIGYVIDGHNRRVGKTVNGVLGTGFLYDANRIVAQLNGSNQLVSQFVYATGSDAPDYMVSGGVTYRIFSDQLGSPVLVVNTTSGAVAEQITYDEFGNVLSDSNPGFQPFGFAGGLYDQDTKLVRFGARDYNPSVGRWTAKDPILFTAGDPNLYGYVLSDPVNLTDSTGLQADCPCLEKPKKSWVKDATEKVAPHTPDPKVSPPPPAPDDDNPYTKNQGQVKVTPPSKSVGGGMTVGVGAATVNVSGNFTSQGGTKGEVKLEVNVKDKTVTCGGTF